MEVCDIVQETGIKTIPKKCKKAKWLSEEALKIAVKRREVKNKGEKERYTHLSSKELPDVQAGFRKGRGTEIKLPTSAGPSRKQESSRKTSISALLTMPKPLTVWITIKCGNSERDGNTRPPDLPLEKPICRSGSNS